MKKSFLQSCGIIISLSLLCFSFTPVSFAEVTVRVPNQEMLSKAKEYNRSVGGQSLVVMHQGKVLLEDYANGGKKDKLMMLASGTKSFNGVVALAAIEDGIMKLDDKVSDSLIEWKKDPLKSQITYQHLLTMTSGLRGSSFKQTWEELVHTLMSGKPGKQYVYGPTHLNIFAEAIQRSTKKLYGESYEQYLKRRILDPIGVKVHWGIRYDDGNPQVSGGAFMTSKDWAMFGEWVRNNGAWKSKQIIKADLFPLLSQGTESNPAYGLSWWLKEPVSKDQIRKIPILRSDMGEIANSDWLPEDLFMAAGAGKQLLYIIPSLELVVVRQASLGNEKYFRDMEFLGLLLKSKEKLDPGFTPEDIAMGDEALSYGDPEFEPYGTRMVFQDRLANNSIWVDYLNPETGEFSTKNGKNILVDVGIAPLKESRQGPEWGVSKEGSALFYSKKDAKGIMQIWRATFQDSKIRTQQLTHSRQNMYGVFASQSPASDSIKVACIQGEVATGSAVWFDENTPMDITILPNAYFWVKSFRFSPDARYLFYSYQSSRNKYEKGKAQIAVMDTTTNKVKILTMDSGNKDEPCPFIAPEFGHELCVATTVDNEMIAIYRDTKDPSGVWSKVAEIEMPEDSKHPFMHSLELVQAENKNFKFSYFAIVAYPDNEGDGKSVREDGSLWLFGLGDHLARRVDQAMPGHKLEPEIWLGNQEVFYYYSFIDLDKNPNIALLRRCKTGLYSPVGQKSNSPIGF